MPKLLEACCHSRCARRIRVLAAGALGYAGGASAVRFLAERLLHDASDKVQMAAAQSLAYQTEILATRALKDALQLRLPDAIRFECLRSLALRGESDGVTAMVACALDRRLESPRRFVAIHTLGKCTQEEGRMTLRRVAEDVEEPEYVRERCLDSLAIVQREQGWRALVGGGWDRP